MKWLVRILIGLAALVAVLFAVVVGALMWFHIPQNASGMAAITICDAVFVSGRTASADELMASEVAAARELCITRAASATAVMRMWLREDSDKPPDQTRNGAKLH